MHVISEKLLGGKQGAVNLLILALLLFVIFPLWLDLFRLNLLGKYVTYAYVAVGLVYCGGMAGF